MRVLIADDQQDFRMVFSAFLKRFPNVVVVGEAEDGVDVIEKTDQLDPDVIVMDISMPRCNGLDATRILKSRWPKKKVLIASMHGQQFYKKEALKARADGFVLKSALDERLYEVLGQGPSLLTLADEVVDIRDVSN